MEQLTFQVAEYDAPLDLILSLIQKHKLKITDIDISSLLAQYLAAIAEWQERNLDVASEFLEMASRLVYMKSLSLLPRHEEEAELLRRELSGQLVEYRLLKLAAQRLGGMNLSQDIFVREPQPFEVDETYTLTHPAGILFTALTDALGKNAQRMPPPRETFAPLVSRPVISVSSRIFGILRRLRREQRVPLTGLFEPAAGRSGMVATFLGVLELIKSNTVVLERGRVRLRK